MKHKFEKILVPLILVVSPGILFGAAVLTNVGGSISEDFNSYDFGAQTTNTTATWVNNSTVPNWYADSRATTIAYRFGGGVSSTTEVLGYKFDANGNTTSPAGALGTRSSSTDPWGIGWAIENGTGTTLTEFSLTYDAFVASYEGDAGPDGYTVTYQIGGTYQDDGFANVYASAQYVAPINQADDAGNPVTASTVTGSTVTGINWAPGEILWIHWQDTSAVSGESTYGLGIDNITLTAVPEPTTFALLAGMVALAGVLYRRRVK